MSVYDDSMLIQERFQRVDDTEFLLLMVVYFFYRASIASLVSEPGLQQLCEHTVAEVAFDQYQIDLVFLGFIMKYLHTFI